jgi:tRNA(fMet)-specific endonuclease VapC
MTRTLYESVRTRTDTLQLFQDGNPTVIAHVSTVAPGDLATSVITIEEQLSGWYTELRQAKRVERLAWAYRRLAATIRFLVKIQIVDFDEPAIQRCQELKKLKLKIRKMDLRIAVTVIERGGVLVTRNIRDFKQVPGLKIEDWSK